jgi:hypothetical protein
MWRHRLSLLPARLGAVLQDDVARAGGSWVAAFFLVGLLFKFSNPTRNTLRGFTLAAIGVLLPLQALLGPGAARESALPGTDYLAVVGPLILVLGTAFFVSMLEHTDWPIEGIRPLAVALFCLVAVAPIALKLMPPGSDPRRFPPYHPPLVRLLADWIEPGELLMSDIPWAVAWYGDRSCLWLTQYAVEPRGREDFFAVARDRRDVVGLYLTQTTTDRISLTDMYEPESRPEVARARAPGAKVAASQDATLNAVGWPELVQRSLSTRWLPAGFPLQSASAEFARWGQLLVFDAPRWAEGRGEYPGGLDPAQNSRKALPSTSPENP